MATSEPQSDSHKTPTGDSIRSEEQITIFHNGQVFVSDVTELQARAIILLAAREMEGRDRSMWSSAALLAFHSRIYGPPGVSLKRSLQSFLQKRKQRSQAASPYNSTTNL
ncbi:protein TIFY 5A-like [Pyrus x bretschneideri]|uniref:protein TIFY 5A-like n=1 Tax=Pyrus x bretschneideri TaxID=225117 RepID=UPI000511ACFA|nr:protein TIFY 5A-like [Pyrus x bretschneideri]